MLKLYQGEDKEIGRKKHMVILKLLLLCYHQRILDGAEVKNAPAI